MKHSSSMKGFGLSMTVLLLASCESGETPTQPTADATPGPALAVAANSWVSKAPMPTARFGHAAGVAYPTPGKPVLYAIGGIVHGEASNKVESYDFATNTWTTVAPIPIALSHTNGVGLIGGKLYVAGGQSTSGSVGIVPRLYVYDPVRDTWTRKRDVPRPVSRGVTGVIKGKLYVFPGVCSGCPDGGISRRLYRYDPATNSWDSSLPLSPQSHFSGAGGVINGKFYVVGGSGNDTRITNQLNVYDPAVNKWTTKAPIPEGRHGAAGAVLKGKLYILGGLTAASGDIVSTVEAYDPVTDTWTTKASMLKARDFLAAVSVATVGKSPRILAVGGFAADGTILRANEAYKP